MQKDQLDSLCRLGAARCRALANCRQSCGHSSARNSISTIENIQVTTTFFWIWKTWIVLLCRWRAARCRASANSRQSCGRNSARNSISTSMSAKISGTSQTNIKQLRLRHSHPELKAMLIVLRYTNHSLLALHGQACAMMSQTRHTLKHERKDKRHKADKHQAIAAAASWSSRAESHADTAPVDKQLSDLVAQGSASQTNIKQQHLPRHSPLGLRAMLILLR